MGGFSNYKAYPEYKNSGVEWIGDIPERWTLKKIKFMAFCIPSNVDKKQKEGEQSIRLCNYTDIYYNDEIVGDLNFLKASATKNQIKKFSLLQNDVIITKDSEDPNDIAVASFVPKDLEGIVCGYHLAIIRVKQKNDGKYIKYIFNSHYAKGIFAISCNGLTRYGLGTYAIKNVLFPSPPLDEQTQIAAYLDNQTTKIDQIIHEKQELIELLKKKKISLITKCVTKGLDDNVKMKDSGVEWVEWIGEIPEGWEVKKLKYGVVVNPSKKSIDKNSTELVVFLPMENVKEDGEINCSIKKPISNLYNCFTYFNKNDVIVAKITPCFENGKGAILNKLTTNLGFGSTEFHVLRTNKNVNNLFLYYLTKSKIFMTVGEAFMSGAAGQKRVPTNFISDFPLVLPPLDEQTAIAAFLDNKTIKIDQAVLATQESIELLKKYKAALITSAVTGKIDVRDWDKDNQTKSDHHTKEAIIID